MASHNRLLTPPSAAATFPRIANVYGGKAPGNAAAYQRYALAIANVAPDIQFLNAVAALGSSAVIPFYIAIEEVLQGYPPNFFGGTAAYATVSQFYPLWWLCYIGSTLNGAVTAGAATITVTDGTKFAVNDYILVMNKSTSPISEVEHMLVTAISTNVLTVTRGQGNSTAAGNTPSGVGIAHTTGTYVAAHASAGFGAWMLNVSRYCPVDPVTTSPTYNRTWADVLVGYVLKQLNRNPWGGVFYDNLNPTPTYTNINGHSWLNIDLDLSGAVSFTSGPPYGIRQAEWSKGLLSILASTRVGSPGTFVMGNANIYAGLTAGQEYESFPNFPPPAESATVGIMNLYGAPSSYGRTGQYIQSIINPNFASLTPASYNNATDLALLRRDIAFACLVGVAFAKDGGALGHGQTWWFDEYDQGVGSSLSANVALGVAGSLTGQTITVVSSAPFAVGDVLQVPNDGLTPNAWYAGYSGMYDDEQMLVTGIAGNTITVTRGYNSTYYGTHKAGCKVFTVAQQNANRGWLGAPLGDTVFYVSGTGTPSLSFAAATQVITNGGFDTLSGAATAPFVTNTPTGWSADNASSAVGTFTPDNYVTAPGQPTNGYSLRIDTTTPSSNGQSYGVDLSSPNITATTVSTTFTLGFWAKCQNPAGSVLTASFQLNGGAYTSYGATDLTLTPLWGFYLITVTIPASTPTPLRLVFSTAQKPDTIWIDGVLCVVGEAGVGMRPFQNGLAISNMGVVSQAIALPSTYRRIAGSQDATTNSGLTAVSPLTVPPGDGILLRV